MGHRGKRTSVAPDRRKHGEDHSGLKHARRELPDRDSNPIVDQRGTKARDAPLKASSDGRKQRKRAGHRRCGSHGGHARSSYEHACGKAYGNSEG